MPDGMPLAQVRITDPRGYHTFLEQSTDYTEPGSRQRSGTSEGSRLRLAEVFGSRGSKAGQFSSPTGLAVDPSGVLFVADSYNHRIQRITPSGGVAVIGGRGNGRGQFLSPQGVAADAQQAFYVVEQGNHRVQKFTAQGVLQLVFGRSGRGDGEMRGPTDIAVAPGSGDIYVADTGNSRVQKFDNEGNFLATLGAAGGLYAPLVSPQSLTVDASDNVYVADTFANRIVQYDPLGRPVARFHPLSFYQPRAVACDAHGRLYVTDTVTTETEQGEERGRLQVVSTGIGPEVRTTAEAPETFSLRQRPGGVAVTWGWSNSKGSPTGPPEVYVSDTINHRVLRFTWS